MNVSLAKTAGFCFGVKRAVDMAYTEAAKGKPVYTLGPIIHNEEVVADLKQKGVLSLSEDELIYGKYPLWHSIPSYGHNHFHSSIVQNRSR